MFWGSSDWGDFILSINSLSIAWLTGIPDDESRTEIILYAGGLEMFKKRDLVCQAKVSKSIEHKYQLNGKMYYFDSAACLATFKSEPQRFVKEKKGGFLAFIAKDSKDVPKSCH